jgi:hypothetical protein
MAETNADPAPAPVPKGILLKADTIAEPFLAEVKANLAAVLSASSSRGPPKLVGILATASAAPSRSYAEFTRKQCTALSIAFELREVDQDDGVEEAIIEANADSSVDGIMVRLSLSRSSISSHKTLLPQVYYPIFGKEQVRLVSCSCYDTHCLPNCMQQDHYLQQIVSPFKDVEGLNYKFHYNLYHKLRPPHSSHSHLPFALTNTQHPLPRTKVPPRILALSRDSSTSTANQRRRPTCRNRQVDLTMHASGRRKSTRACRCIQRAVAVRRPGLRPHRNRHQPVIPRSFPLLTLTNCEQKVGSGRPPAGSSLSQRRRTCLLRRHRLNTGVQ